MTKGRSHATPSSSRRRGRRAGVDSLKIVAPWREWDIRSREDAIAYAAKHNVPVTATIKSIYSRDSNLWHMSHEGGLLEDPWNGPPEEIYAWTRSIKDAPEVFSGIVDSYEPRGPYGAKEIGEGSLVPVLGAIANAVYDACGVRVTELPITPEKIWQAMRKPAPDGAAHA